MFNERHFAYSNVRNYICAQIAFTKEKIANGLHIKELENEYLDDRKEELETYQKILNLLSDNKKKLTAKES